MGSPLPQPPIYWDCGYIYTCLSYAENFQFAILPPHGGFLAPPTLVLFHSCTCVRVQNLELAPFPLDFGVFFFFRLSFKSLKDIPYILLIVLDIILDLI